jgi:hypothetical protein
MVHILHHVKATRIQPLESLKGLLTKEEYKKYKSSPMRGKTWLNLTSDVFVAFLLWIRNTLFFQHYSMISLEILSIVQCYLECLTCQATTSLQQEMAEASDEATKKYAEEIPENERSDSGVMAVMRAAAKNKAQSFKGQFSKYTTSTNPKLGDEFLEEVCQIYLCDHFILSNGPFIDYLYRCKSFVVVRDHVMVAIGLNNYHVMVAIGSDTTDYQALEQQRQDRDDSREVAIHCNGCGVTLLQSSVVEVVELQCPHL